MNIYAQSSKRENPSHLISRSIELGVLLLEGINISIYVRKKGARKYLRNGIIF